MVQRVSLADELTTAGWSMKGTVPCPKCQQQVHKFESPSGTHAYTNLPTHPTAPGRNHIFSCGEATVDHSLPPVPDQDAIIRGVKPE